MMTTVMMGNRRVGLWSRNGIKTNSRLAHYQASAPDWESHAVGIGIERRAERSAERRIQQQPSSPKW
jgi:hypothetical protein